MPESTKGRCPVCHHPKPIALRKDGTLCEHPARSGTRPCGGTGQNPAPVEATDPREWAVLDGLVEREGGER